MASIVVLKWRGLHNQCKYRYLKSKKKIQFFIAFLKFKLNFKYFEAKDKPQSLRISKIIDSEKLVYLDV